MYRQSLDTMSVPILPRTLEIAVESSIRYRRGDASEAEGLLSEAERKGIDIGFAMGPILGPVIGPVAGGYLAAAKGWRWNFWLITIVGGFFLCLSLLLMRETYEPVLLQKKVNKLRKETGNMQLRSKLAPTITQAEYFKRSIRSSSSGGGSDLRTAGGLTNSFCRAASSSAFLFFTAAIDELKLK